MFTKGFWMSKDTFWGFINVFLVVAILGGLVGVKMMLRSSNAVIPSRTITVSGEGKVKVAPDLATMTFAVVSQGQNPEAIQTTNTEKMNRAIAYLKDQGVAEKDIETTGYNLYPQYRYDNGGREPAIVGYELVQTVTVKVRALENVGKLVAGVTTAGANRIDYLQFTVEDPEATMNEAREQAFMKAREKAMAMAAANGVRIARVINFSESGYPIPYYERAFGKGGDMAVGAPTVAPIVQPGEEEITVTVSVTYEIR